MKNKDETLRKLRALDIALTKEIDAMKNFMPCQNYLNGYIIDHQTMVMLKRKFPKEIAEHPEEECYKLQISQSGILFETICYGVIDEADPRINSEQEIIELEIKQMTIRRKFNERQKELISTGNDKRKHGQ